MPAHIMSSARGANTAEVHGFVGYLTSTLAYGVCRVLRECYCCALRWARLSDTARVCSYVYDLGLRSGVHAARVRYYLLSEQVRAVSACGANCSDEACVRLLWGLQRLQLLRRCASHSRVAFRTAPAVSCAN